MLRHPLTVLVVMLASACAHGYASAVSYVPPRDAPDTTAEGIVRVVGADPIPTVVLEVGGSGVTLLGPLVPELARLVGARVSVRGAAATANVPVGSSRAAIAVRDYTIREIAGGVPVVGLLTVEPGRVLHVNGVKLAGVPSGLAELAGAKVWVVGTRRDDGALAVSAYGVIAMPSDSASR